jgi:hypothetical protein
MLGLVSTVQYLLAREHTMMASNAVVCQRRGELVPGPQKATVVISQLSPSARGVMQLRNTESIGSTNRCS